MTTLPPVTIGATARRWGAALMLKTAMRLAIPFAAILLVESRPDHWFGRAYEDLPYLSADLCR
jgi:hypothetical protein